MNQKDFQGIKYKGDRDLNSLEVYLRESLGMEIEDKKQEEFEEKFQIEDGVYMLTNITFSQVLANSYCVQINFFSSRLSTMIATHLLLSVRFGAFPVRGFRGPGPISGIASLGRMMRYTSFILVAYKIPLLFKVRIAEVDCNLYPDVCQQESIVNYPTLIYYR